MDIEVLGIRGLPQVKAGSDAVAAVHVAVWARFAAAHASVQGSCARDLRLLTRALGVPVLVCVCVCERESVCVCVWCLAPGRMPTTCLFSWTFGRMLST